MRIKKYYLYILILLVFFASCEKEVQEKFTGEYLVSYELVSSFSKDLVTSQITIGSLLYPEVTSLITTVNYGVNIYKITYNTTFLGEPIIASGLISLPDSEDSFPILSFQNGTNTCNSNAPSVKTTEPVYALISYMASNGYILCIPDYIGFGASEDILHPYMHRSSSDIAIIDFLKATIELTELESSVPSANNTLYLMGYSQGGWATLSVLDALEQNPIENLDVSAAVCGAGSYDLVEMSDYILQQETYPNPFYLPYFIESRRQNSILSDHPTTFYNEPYATIIPSLFDGTQCNSTINEQLNDTISGLLTQDLIENLNTSSQLENLKNELKSNSVDAWQTSASLRFFHSKGDKSLPYTQSTSIYSDFDLLGSDAELVLVDSLDHSEAIISWGVDAITWLNNKK